jgi:hypothetical protein
MGPTEMKEQARLRRAALVDWLLLPESERVPSTRKAFAEEWGVSPETIRTDSLDPRVQNELIRRGRQLQRADRTLDVVNALYQRALGGDGIPEAAANTAAKIWLDWTSQKEVNIDELDLEQLSDEEVMDLMVRFREQMNQR